MGDLIIYSQEMRDGLGEALAARRAVSWLSPLTPGKTLPDRDRERVCAHLARKAIAQANPGQFDLYYLEDILVSTGWNLNDDVFAPEEVWAARRTPEDKPFNYQHDEKDIVGHITSVTPVDEKGNPLDEALAADQAPDRFHLRTGSVLYRHWDDEERKIRAEKIISEIPEGKWFVSMECLFWSFDYALQEEGKAEATVVARNARTSFLTRHLRAYGGDGTYQGKRVGRLFRNIVFSGKGLVERPGNPESVILSAHACSFRGDSPAQRISPDENSEKGNIPLDPPLGNSVYQTAVSELSQPAANHQETERMSQTTLTADQQVVTLTAKIADLEAQLSKAGREAIEKQVADLRAATEQQKGVLDQALARAEELEKANKALSEQIREISEKAATERRTVEEALAARTQEVATLQTQVNQAAAEKRRADRLASVKARLNTADEKAVALVDRLASLSDEDFAGVLEAQAAIAGSPGQRPAPAPQVTTLPAPATPEVGGTPVRIGKGYAREVLDHAERVPQPALVATVPAGELVEKARADIARFYGCTEEDVDGEGDGAARRRAGSRKEN